MFIHREEGVVTAVCGVLQPGFAEEELADLQIREVFARMTKIPLWLPPIRVLLPSAEFVTTNCA